MSDVNVSKIQQKIQTFKAQNPELVEGLSDKKIASIMIEQGKLSADAIKKISIMSNLEDLEAPYTSLPQEKETSLSGSQLASEMIEIADSNFPWEKSISTAKFQELLAKMGELSTDELISFVKSFKKDGFSVNIFGIEIGDKEESIIELICDEYENADTKKNACNKVFEALIKKAEELHIDTNQFKTQFNWEIMKKINNDLIDTQTMDEIIDAITQAIENRLNLTEEEITQIANTPKTEAEKQTTDILTNKLNQAFEAFGERIDENGEFTNKNKQGVLYQGQMQQDGWSGRWANKIKETFNSDNSTSNIRETLKYAQEQIDNLNNKKDTGLFETPLAQSFEERFEDIFGIKYDYMNIATYQKVEQQYILASKRHEEETQFNEKFKALLQEGPLRKEVERIDSYDVNHATYITKNTKEEVYEREYRNLSEYSGSILLTQLFKNNNLNSNASLNQQIEFLRNLAKENSIKLTHADINEETFKKEFDMVAKKLGEKVLNQLFEKNGVLNGTLEQKFEVMKQLAKETSQNLHKNTMSTTQGKDFSEIQRMYDYSYTAAFGINNDIMKKVTDYTVSQQIGAGLIKTGVIIGATVAATVATGGAGGAVMLGTITAGTSAAAEISDKATNEIDNEKDLYNASSAWNITVDSAIAGISAGAGGKAADAIWRSNAGKIAKYIKTSASDIGIGTAASGAGLLAKGQSLSDMTADEVFMNTLFAALGGAINVATSKTVYTALNGKKSFQITNATEITNRLAKEGRLTKTAFEQKHNWDLKTINKGKDLTAEQLIILDKVLNSKAIFTTEEINNLLTIKNPADIDTRIANLTPFKPQKGKEAIIEENGVIQINTNSPKVVINYLIKRGYFQNEEIQLNLGQILSINNKQPLTRGQIAVLNEVINTKFKKTWDNKINYPRVSELDKLLSLQDVDLAKAIIKNNQSWGLIENLSRDNVKLFKSMMAEKDKIIQDKYTLTNEDIVLASQNRELFDKIYNFREVGSGDRYIDSAFVLNYHIPDRIKTVLDVFPKLKQVCSSPDLRYELRKFIINSSDEKFNTSVKILQEINNSLSSKKNREISHIFNRRDPFSFVLENINLDNLNIVKLLISKNAYLEKKELKELTYNLNKLRQEAQKCTNKDFIDFINQLDKENGLISKLTEHYSFKSYDKTPDVPSINNLLKNLNAENYDILPVILNSDKSMMDNISIENVLLYTNKTNKDIFLKLFNSKTYYTLEQINDIIKNITPENKKYVDKLLHTNELNSWVISKILLHTNANNAELLDKLLSKYNNTNLSKYDISGILKYSNLDKDSLNFLINKLEAGEKIQDYSEINAIMRNIENCPEVKPLISKLFASSKTTTGMDIYEILSKFDNNNFSENLNRLEYLINHPNIEQTHHIAAFLSCSTEKFEVLNKLLNTKKVSSKRIYELDYIDEPKIKYLKSFLDDINNINPKDLLATLPKINDNSIEHVNKLRTFNLSNSNIIDILNSCESYMEIQLISNLLEKFDGISSVDKLPPHKQLELNNLLLSNNTGINVRGAIYPQFLLDRLPLLPTDATKYGIITKQIKENLNNIQPIKLNNDLLTVMQKLVTGISDTDTNNVLSLLSKYELNINTQDLSNALMDSIKKFGNTQNVKLILAYLFIKLAKTNKNIENKIYLLTKELGLKHKDANNICDLLKAYKSAQEYTKICQNPELDGEIEQTFRIFHALNATKKNYALALCANKLISNDNFKLAQQLFLDSLPEDIKSAIIAKRNELKSSSFALPQTDFKNLPADIIHTKTIKIREKPVVINYVYASDIKDFNAYVHCPDVQYANQQSIETALNNFNVFETEGCSDAIICVSYIGKNTTNKIVTGMGLILGTNSNSQHVFYNQDIMSLAKEKDILVLEYMTDKDVAYNEKKTHFDNVANTMKKDLNLDNDKYIQFTDKQKDLSEGTILTTNHCKQACEELHIDYSAYQNCLNKLYNINGGYTEGLISDVKVVACALKKREFDKLMNGVIDYDYDLQNLIKFANERTLNIIILD